MIEKFLNSFKETGHVNNVEPINWQELIAEFDFADNLISNYGGKTFNNGLFRIHTRESSIKWTNLITKEYFKEEIGEMQLLCFGFNWQGCMYCVNVTNDKIIYFDPATCEYFLAEDFSIFNFFNNILLEGEYDIIAEEYFDEAISFLKFSELDFSDSIGHKIYLHLGGEDDVQNLEIVDTEVLWDLQIQTAESINELPD